MRGRQSGDEYADCRVELLVREGDFKFSCGGHFAIDQAAAFGGDDAAADADDLGLDEEGVAGQDRAAPFYFVDTHEVTDFPLVFGHA